MDLLNDSPRKSPVFQRNIYRALVLFSVTVFLGGAMAVPFCYETQTLWYKAGVDKVLLRAGQLAGMLALFLLVLQILLALRGKFFEGLFGGANLMRWHRINGVCIACAALCHVALVLVPEGLDNLPIGKKYWPEMVGAVLFFCILFVVLSSHFRAAFHWDYKQWRTLHRPLGYLIAVLVLIHVLFVSGSFEQGAPKSILLSIFTGLALLIGISKTIRWRLS